MGFDLLSLMLSGDAKKLLKSLATKEGFWQYVANRTSGFDDWTIEQKTAGRAVFDEIFAMLGLKKILKRG